MFTGDDQRPGSATDADGVKTTAFLLPGLKVLAVGSTTQTPAQQASSAATRHDADDDGAAAVAAAR